VSGDATEALPLPAPADPAFLIPEPRGLARTTARWATVVRSVPARSAPAVDATPVASVQPVTPEETTNVVLATDSAADESGRLWIAIRVPALPENLTGWVPRSALGTYGFVRTRLVVDLELFSATLFRDGRPIFRARVGVGKPSWPTPTGEFYVRSKLWSLRSPFYGPLAFGTSARSTVLTDWPDGGFIGIHGTSRPELLPGRVSHGCIRMRNDDILELGRLMPVGTPVTIR
jgi:lipoprotein-anchoring transpeptidase ErfK/SrfK